MTRFEAASKTLRTVANASGLPGLDEQRMLACFRRLTESWAEAPVSAPPSWSGLGADASGCDVSMVLDGRRQEVRVTVEAQAQPPSPQAYWYAAMRLSNTLEAEYGADLSRLRVLEDVFAPLDPEAAGVLWHGAVFRPGRPPWFKVYLHLMARGRRHARATARAAIERLELDGCWAEILSHLAPSDELLFLGFDLVSADEARVKLYIRHAETTAAALDHAARALDPDGGGQVGDFVNCLTGGCNRVLRRGALTSLHLKHGCQAPSHLSTHIRLYPHCSTSDAVLFSRIRQALRRLDIPDTPYRSAVAALASQDLDKEEGLHGWASLQRVQGRPSVTVYLSPRIYFQTYGPIALDPARMWPSPVGSSACNRQPVCASP